MSKRDDCWVSSQLVTYSHILSRRAHWLCDPPLNPDLHAWVAMSSVQVVWDMRTALCCWCMKPFWVFVRKPKGDSCVWTRRHGPRQNVDICRARNENRLLIPSLSEYCRFELMWLGLATDSVHQYLLHPGSPKRKKSFHTLYHALVPRMLKLI